MTEWGKTIGSVLGGAVAGPFGAIIGSILGSTIESVTPDVKDIAANVLAGLGTDGLKQLAQQGYQQFQSPAAIQVNHDLQIAFRDALREAIYDIGGRECFPQAWSQPRRQSPDVVHYPVAALRHWDKVLADQVCASLNEFSAAVDGLLPLTAPSIAPISVEPYLLNNPTNDLERTFWQQVVQPFLARHPVAPEVAAAFEEHLRRHLLPRTLVHLGENLKQRPEAWRAFNRLLLETMQQTLTEAAANDANLLQELAAMRAQLANLEVPDSEQLAELISELGETRRHQDERFDQLQDRVIRQHREVISAIGGVRESVIDAEKRLSQKIAELSTIQVISSEIQDLPPLAGEPPYKGLLAYEQADEAIYFGRRELASSLAQSLRDRNFVAVVGASGSGKSSLVGAGTLPILARQGWRIFEMTPTTQPLDKVAQTLYPQNSLQRQRLRREVNEDAHALAEAGARLAAAAPARRGLLVVDQFEELFTQAQDEAANRAFVAALLALRSSTVVSLVIVLRSDFYHRCADYEGLLSAVAGSQVALEALSNRQLLDVIGQPLIRNSWRIQEGLAQTIIEDVGREAGGLPFLAHALRETWERRRHNVLTLSGYQGAGGVKGAITESAEAAWVVFNAHEKSAARTILLELTELGEREGDQLHTPDTRRRRSYMALSQLSIAPATLDSVLEELVRRRLLIRDQEHIEVAHEALIRGWPRLQQWLETDHAHLQVARQIEAEADNWEKHQRDPSYLAHGARLAQASEWAAGQPQFPAGRVGAFLQASIAAEELERHRELEQAQKLAAAQSRRARTFRWAAIITGILSVIAIVAAIWAVNSQRAAEESATAASISAVQAQAESTRAAQAADSANSARATADANAAEAQVAQAEAEVAQAQAEVAQTEAEVAQAEAEVAAHRAQSRALTAAAQAEAESNPMRSWLLAIEAGQTADTEQAFSAINEHASVIAKPLTHFTHSDAVAGALWNDDGNRILSWSWDNTVHVWDAKSDDAPLTLDHEGIVNGASWNDDGNRILSWSDDTIHVWDAGRGELLATLTHSDTVNGAVWNDDESRILSWGNDNTARVWDVGTEKLLVIVTHSNPVLGAAWNNDETRVLSWGDEILSDDHTIRVWDAKSDDAPLTLAHGGIVNGASWSDDGRRILSWSGDNTVGVWDAVNGVRLLTLNHNSWVAGAMWNGDDSRILSWGDDNTVRIWDAESGERLRTISGDSSNILSAQWSHAEDQIMVITSAGRIYRYYSRMPETIQAACARATRNLTWSEWQLYVPGEAYRQTCPNLPVHPSVAKTAVAPVTTQQP